MRIAPRTAGTLPLTTEVRNMVNEAQRRLRHEQGTWVPAARRSFTFDDAGVRVTLHGASLGANPVATYEGPAGNWQAYYTSRGCGKPWSL